MVAAGSPCCTRTSRPSRWSASLVVVVIVGAVASAACSHTVVIDSEPSGAVVRIDGETVGQAPVSYTETTGWQRIYTLEASKPGFVPAHRIVSQSEWSSSVLLVSGIGTGLWVTSTLGAGLALPWPLIGIFWARQLPDRIVIPLEPATPQPAVGAPRY